MIIDRILDRKDGQRYSAREFYWDCAGYGKVGDYICYCMDELEEIDVKAAICKYIIDNEYNPDICGYVWSVDWLKND